MVDAVKGPFFPCAPPFPTFPRIRTSDCGAAGSIASSGETVSAEAKAAESEAEAYLRRLLEICGSKGTEGGTFIPREIFSPVSATDAGIFKVPDNPY